MIARRSTIRLWRRPPTIRRSTGTEWDAERDQVGRPEPSLRALPRSIAEMGKAPGRPPVGRRPREGITARVPSGDQRLRYEPGVPMVGTTGDIEAPP